MANISQEADSRLRALTRKWVAQANHPMRQNMPEVREAMFKCARDLREALEKIRQEGE